MKMLYIFIFPIAFVTGLYSVFVLQTIWNWFVVPFFHLHYISFLEMFGLSLVVNLVFDMNTGKNNMQEHLHWKVNYSLVTMCIPENRIENMDNELKDLEESKPSDIFQHIIRVICERTWVLFLGWIVHKFLLPYFFSCQPLISF